MTFGLITFVCIVGALTAWRVHMMRLARRQPAPFDPTTGTLFKAMLGGGQPSAGGPFTHTFTPAEPEVLEVRITDAEFVEMPYVLHRMTVRQKLRDGGIDPDGHIVWFDDLLRGARVYQQLVDTPALTVEDVDV